MKDIYLLEENSYVQLTYAFFGTGSSEYATKNLHQPPWCNLGKSLISNFLLTSGKLLPFLLNKSCVFFSFPVFLSSEFDQQHQDSSFSTECCLWFLASKLLTLSIFAALLYENDFWGFLVPVWYTAVVLGLSL